MASPCRGALTDGSYGEAPTRARGFAILAAIFIPCLNERDTISKAVRSLGFGLKDEATPEDTLLVLIDNGSADGTRDALTGIGRRSRRGTVVVVDEAERGYLPPRSASIEAAARGVSPSNLLIVQGDDDTIYREGCVRAFLTAAEDRLPALFEGLSHPPAPVSGRASRLSASSRRG